MEEANGYLNTVKSGSKKFAFGVVICIVSVIPLLILSAAGNEGLIRLTEDQGGFLGLLIMFMMVALAVAIFILYGRKLSHYSFLNREVIETEYGVSGMVKERQKAYSHRHTLRLALGVVICILSVIPIFVTLVIDNENSFLFNVGIAGMFLTASVGVYMIVETAMIWKSFAKFSEEKDIFVEEEETDKKGSIALVMGIYCEIVAAIYMVYTFTTDDWENTWLIPAVGAVLSGVVYIVAEMIQSRKNK